MLDNNKNAIINNNKSGWLWQLNYDDAFPVTVTSQQGYSADQC